MRVRRVHGLPAASRIPVLHIRSVQPLRYFNMHTNCMPALHAYRQRTIVDRTAQAVPITVRQLEALVRISESLAKMRLSAEGIFTFLLSHSF